MTAFKFAQRARVSIPMPLVSPEQRLKDLCEPFHGTREMTYDEHCEHEDKLNIQAQLNDIYSLTLAYADYGSVN